MSQVFESILCEDVQLVGAQRHTAARGGRPGKIMNRERAQTRARVRVAWFSMAAETIGTYLRKPLRVSFARNCAQAL
jgi:hypothetical protein